MSVPDLTIDLSTHPAVVALFSRIEALESENQALTDELEDREHEASLIDNLAAMMGGE